VANYCFPNLKANIENLKKKDKDYLTGHEGCVELFCKDCDFFREDERDLECGAFKLLKKLMDNKIITPEDIFNVVSD